VTERETLIAYLKMKVDQADWHGVSDAANDLRVLEAALPIRGPLGCGNFLPKMGMEAYCARCGYPESEHLQRQEPEQGQN
jgi:hypothetical protein